MRATLWSDIHPQGKLNLLFAAKLMELDIIILKQNNPGTEDKKGILPLVHKSDRVELLIKQSLRRGMEW